MSTFLVWVRINQLQTANVQILASNGWEAKLIAEAQYGSGNVLNYTEIND